MNTHDPVNHPSHYTSHPSGVECIEITRHMPFNLGNVVKYLWRAGIKGDAPYLQDLEKAAWYLNDEIERRRKEVDAAYRNDVKEGIDEAARTINEAVNPPQAGFEKELEGLINCYSLESGSDTPDFLLSQFLCDVLEAWNKAVVARERWYGREGAPVPPEECPLPPDDTLPGEELDRIGTELKKARGEVEMIDGEPYYLGHRIEEVDPPWDGYRVWEPGSSVRWRGCVWQMIDSIPRDTAAPERSAHWTRLPE